MHRWIIACLLAAWLPATTFCADPPETAELIPVEEEQLLAWLMQQGERLPCYFTLELFAPREPDVRPLDVKKVKIPAPATVKELIQQLRQHVPEAHLIIRETKPPVIHLVDRRLLETDGYPLEIPLRLSFAGTPQELVKTIDERLPQFTLQTGMAIGDHAGDHVTPIELKNGEGSVRELVTDALPRAGYSPVLWRTRSTPGDDGTWTIQWTCFGPLEDEQPAPK